MIAYEFEFSFYAIVLELNYGEARYRVVIRDNKARNLLDQIFFLAITLFSNL